VSLLLLEFFEILLVLFVDTRARLLETFPKRLLVFVGYGARFAPLVMQVLQLAEGRHYRGFEHECLGRFAELYLGLVVAFEVEVAQLLVYLDIIVKVLYVQVVGLPQLLDVRLGDDARLPPALLKFAEGVEGAVHRFVAVYELLQLLDYLEFRAEVLLLLLFDVGQILRPAPAVFGEQLLEACFVGIGLRYEIFRCTASFGEFAPLLFVLGAVEFIEGHLDGFGFAPYLLYGFGLQQRGEQLHQPVLVQPRDIFQIPGRFRVGVLLLRAFFVGRLAHVEFGLGRIERRIFVGEIDGFVFVGPVGPFVFDGRGFLLRRRGNGGRLCDSGASPAFGYVLHIFGLADMFLGNRDVGFLGSHLQGFYSLLCPALFRQPTKVLLFCKKFQDGAANRPKVFIFPSFAADRPRRCKYSRRPGLRHVFFITFAPA